MMLLQVTWTSQILTQYCNMTQNIEVMMNHWKYTFYLEIPAHTTYPRYSDDYTLTDTCPGIERRVQEKKQEPCARPLGFLTVCYKNRKSTGWQ